MKIKHLLSFLFVGFWMTSQAQTVVINEDFESAPYELTPSGSPVWGINSRLQASGSYSDSCTLGLSTTSYLVTNSFSTLGNSSVILEFKHICKIEMSDVAQIAYSIDGGSTWTLLTTSQYLGSGNFASNKFTEFSYATTWQAGTATAIPQNSWWKTEQFDLSSLVANQADVRLRFILNDANNTGPAQRPGWFLDDIKVTIAPSELIPPTLTQLPVIWQDTVFQTGPFQVKAKINDVSGIAFAKVVYSVNAGPNDTLNMTVVNVDTFAVNIPAQPYNTRIDYHIIARDASAAGNNNATSPGWFYVKQAPPVVIIGTGTATQTYMPCYGYYNYGWSAQVYSAAEIGTSGFIDSAFFYVGNTISSYTMTNQRMMVAVVPDSIFASGVMPDSASMTTFWSGDVTWAGPKWFKFVPSTPFYYSGAGHLLIYWINRDGSYASGYPTFQYTNTPVANKAKYVYSDTYTNVFPSSTGTMSTQRPNLKLVFHLNNTVHDASVVEISEPVSSPIPTTGTPYDVRVKIKNVGSDALDNLTINWSVNGVVQTPYSWTGSLLQDQFASNILIGSVTFPSAGNNVIKVWSSNPDGFVDEQPLNDTTTRTYYVCTAVLAGTYTIDPISPTGGSNFQNFTDVQTTLSVCGISDTTIFEIAPGTYDVSMALGVVPGAGSTASVVFTSATGNAADVILRDSATTSAANYIVDLNGSKYIEFHNLTFTPRGNSYGHAVQLRGNSSYNTFEDNIFTGKTTTSTSADLALFYNFSGSLDSNIVIRNNTFQNGSYSIYMYGVSSTSLEKNNLIEGNVFSNYNYCGLYAYYQRGLTIRDNSISSNTVYTTPFGAYLNYCDYAVIDRNNISHPRYYGIYLYYSDGDASVPGQITNNFISVGGTSTSYALNCYYSNYFNVYHNSLNCYSSSTASGMALYYYYSNNFNFKNNVLANHGGGYAFYSTSTSLTSDYNNLYSNGVNLGYYNSANRVDLAAWQTASNKDSNSVSILPMYISNTDLHTIASALDEAATPLGITIDIDGDLRSLTTPDIGADEFTPPAQEASVIGALEPLSGCGLGLEPVTIQIVNNGLNQINGNLTAYYSVNAGAPISEAVTAIIDPDDTLDFTFTTNVDMTAGATDLNFAFNAWVVLTGDPIPANDSIDFYATSLHAPGAVTVSNATIPYGTSTTLNAVASDTVQWFADPALSSLLYTGSSFTTPVLYDTTIYYVATTSSVDYHYTFETDLQGWQALTPCASYTTYNWAWNTDAGAGAAFMTDPSTTSSAMLKSPVLNVFGDEVEFSFRHRFSTESCCDRGLVAYRIDGGPWTHFTPVSGTYSGNDNLSVDPVLASCVAGPTVGTFGGAALTYFTSSGIIPLNGGTQLEIAFAFSSDGSVAGTGWYIDDVQVYKAGCPGQVSEDTVFVTGIPSADLGVISIDQPVSGIELTSAEPVTMKVKNFGTSVASNFTISYQVDGGTAVDEVYTGSLNPGDTLTYLFTQDVDLSSYTTYQIKAYTTLTGDNITINDTAYKSVTNSMLIYCACSATSTGYEDLTGLTIGTTSYTNPAVGAMYTDYTSLTPYLLAPGQTYNISVSSGYPPGYSSQYSCWVNVFIDYNHDGDWTDAGELVYGSATQSSNTVSGSFTVPPSTYNGVTKLRVVLKEGGSQSDTGPCGTYTWGETEDYLVNLIPPIPYDAGVIAIVSPDYIQSEDDQVPVLVDVYNFGTDTLTSIPLEYIANGGAAVPYTWNGTLLPGDTVTITLPDVTVIADSNDICAYTLVIGDTNTFNDQSCAYFMGLPPNIIFEDDMENGTPMYTDAPTLWEHGVPAATIINSAHSPDSVWATVLAGNYPNSATGFVYTPSINFAGITGAYLTFYYWMEAEDNMDGGYVQYSTNNGATWSSLGSINDPAGYNWFDSYASGTPGWTKSTGGWTPSFIKLDVVSGYSTVKFRFGFKSNTTTVNNGWAIDDIKILAPAVAVDAGVIEIISPVDSTVIGNPISVNVRVKNFGTDTLTSIPVTFLLNTGFPPQNGTWTGTLLPDSTTIYTFTQTYPGPSSNYRLCAYTAVTGDPYKSNDSTCVYLSYFDDAGIGDVSDNGVMLLQNMPNPATDQTTISFILPQPGECIITVRNMLGDVILSETLSGQTGRNDYQLPLTSLGQGVYMYSLIFGDIELTRRLTIIR